MKRLSMILLFKGMVLAVAAQCNLIDPVYTLKPIESPTYETVQRINPLDGTRYQSAVPVQMDIYAPQPLPGEVNPLRPAVILCHGANVRRGDVNMRRIANSLATRGYIVASIDYRADMFNPLEIAIVQAACTSAPCKYNSTIRTLYSNAMDVHKAIAYLLANQPVNPNQFFIGGHSLGASTAYFACTVTKDEVAQHFPSGQPSNFLTDPWYTDFTIQRPRIRGGLILSGATLDLSFTDAADPVPMFIFHGTHDAAAPFYSGRQFCGDASNPILYGGAAIAERMDQFPNLSYYFVEARGVAHALSVNCDISTLPNPADALGNLWHPDLIRFMRTTMLDGYPNQVHKVLTPLNSSPYDYCTAASNNCNGADLAFWQQVNSGGTCYTFPAGWPYNSLGTLPWSGPAFADCTLPVWWTSPAGSCGIYGKAEASGDFALAPNHETQHSVQIFPNPAVDRITLQLQGNKDTPTTLEIVDLQGTTIIKQSVAAGTPTLQIELNQVPQGLYLIQATMGDHRLPVQKLIRQ